MLFTEKNTFNQQFAKDPAVISFQNRYILYYSNYQLLNGKKKLGIGIATSADLEYWTVEGSVPLTQPCEENGIGAPCAFVLNGEVHILYQTYGNGKNDAICHAVSRDGIAFKKDETNPVFHPTTDWCCGRAIDADVVFFQNKWFLYFATRDHAFKIQKIGAAYSEGGFSRGCWKRAGNCAVLSPEYDWEGECVEAPAALSYGGKMYLFYGGAYNCSPQQIGCAVSDDGVHFQKLFNHPFLPAGEKGTWNESESGHPYVFVENGNVHLFYQGSPDGGGSWYLSRCILSFREEKPYVKKFFNQR